MILPFNYNYNTNVYFIITIKMKEMWKTSFIFNSLKLVWAFVYSIFKLFSLKLVTSLLALAYSILQVKYFGSSRTIEIYFAAQSLIYLVTSLTQSGQLAEIFLPEIHKLNNIRSGLGFKALNIVINRMFIWGSLVVTLLFIFTPFFLETKANQL